MNKKKEEKFKTLIYITQNVDWAKKIGFSSFSNGIRPNFRLNERAFQRWFVKMEKAMNKRRERERIYFAETFCEISSRRLANWVVCVCESVIFFWISAHNLQKLQGVKNKSKEKHLNSPSCLFSILSLALLFVTSLFYSHLSLRVTRTKLWKQMMCEHLNKLDQSFE